MLHEKHREWLHTRGITDATIEKFAIHTLQEGGQAWLRVPFLEHGQIVNHKWRKTARKDHRMDAGAPLLLWNHQALIAAAEGRLIVTEGEWDGLITDQCEWPQVVSVPNGAPQDATEDVWDAKRYEWFHRHRADLDRVKAFVLATDGDEAGRVLAADLARLFGPERCWFVTYPDGCKDMNEVYLAHGKEGVDKVLLEAKAYPIKGLYTIDDFPEPPDFRSLPNGIEGLEDLWPAVPGTFSIITGWPGHGKSSLVLVAIANLLRQGVPVALGSFETMVKPVLVRRMRAALYQCDEQHDPRVKVKGPADGVLNERMPIISNMHVDDDTELSIEAIIESAIVAVLRHGIRVLVLDPWNEIEHKRGRDESETEYVGRAIRLLKRFARDYDCAVWVVAHPRKPSSDGAPKRPSLLDLAGSANFANKADYGIIVHRPDLATAQVEATVVKKRMGLPGAMGQVMLAWNELNSSYQREDDWGGH